MDQSSHAAQLLESQRPRRGRPRLAEPGVSVKTWLRVSEYDRLIELANSRQMKVSTLVRFLLLLDIDPR